jgi:hypothetical protein
MMVRVSMSQRRARLEISRLLKEAGWWLGFDLRGRHRFDDDREVIVDPGVNSGEVSNEVGVKLDADGPLGEAVCGLSGVAEPSFAVMVAINESSYGLSKD